MTMVKICGLKEAEHVRAAVEAGADAIGFVFANSSRQITLSQAKNLIAEIPSHILVIGVFVNEDLHTIEEYANEIPLDYAQLHGDESIEFVESLRVPVIKAFSISSQEDVQRALNYPSDFYLFDTPGTTYRGGSGKAFDWNILANESIPKEKVILAGGLHADNVREAVQKIQPYMVDVSSGVETSKRKDTTKIHAFVQAVLDKER
ncbi:phosphoribosylanthranilate isomerase [Paenisporosarcina cavernae]|uniref:N-(5'-phosphoribosyl)anthranilate isomerase n=1 Tax=Paenisporosarcina cavernae TaxID=2320858 RepID=A0A385YSM7_9BACL|nr:phosphoribosylanthranilate isomerase [Paenisporosarcina cavernae]AYC28443.1 phosphoribosylanthranilate isomerase [Paenisporosarcina cavernae]